MKDFYRRMFPRLASRGALLVGFVTLDGEDPDFAKKLSAKCQEELPDYMVPARFIHLKEFPYGKTGKHDVNELKKIARNPQ